MADILIGIAGHFGTGKTTFASMLKDVIPHSDIVAFSDGLKSDVHQWLCDKFGTAFDHLAREQLEALKPHCLGPIYQGYGETARHLLGPDHWIKRLEASLPPRAIIHDVRHINEAYWIRANGGYLLAMEGPIRIQTTRSLTHPSEIHIPQVMEMAHYKIDNMTSLSVLQAQAKTIANVVLHRGG
jgi:energy-coupling factor transporter ATP-binding protein EcfA2